MPLSMSRPWKHPDSGVYWFRRAVPADLRARVGKREEKRSLQTKDPSVARRRHAEALAEVEARWANLRGGVRTLSEREAHALAAVAHDRWLELYKDNPSEQTTWRIDLGDRLWRSPVAPAGGLTSDFLSEYDADTATLRDMENWCRAGAKDCLAAQGLVVSQESERVLARALSFAIQRASLTLARYAKGEFGIGPRAGGVWQGNSSVMPEPGLPVPLAELTKGWSAERKPAQKTLYEWTRVLRQLEAFLGHDYAGRISNEDLIAWKSSMVRAGLWPKTIQNAKLAPVRTILQWGVDNRRLGKNPADIARLLQHDLPAEPIKIAGELIGLEAAQPVERVVIRVPVGLGPRVGIITVHHLTALFSASASALTGSGSKMLSPAARRRSRNSIPLD